MSRSRLPRALATVGAVITVVGGVTLGFTVSAMVAGAVATLTVTPSSGLTSGETVHVSGSGFAKSSPGAILECNSDTHQPTITVLGNAVPVSCTSPLSKLVTTDPSGNVPSTSFIIVGSTTGPPTTIGTDSTGGNPTTDAAKFPCPPTAAQVTAGDTCVIAFGDLAKDMATASITFKASSPPPTTTVTGSTTTTTSGSKSLGQTVGVVVSSSATTTTTTTVRSTTTTAPASTTGTSAATTTTAPSVPNAAAKGTLASTGVDPILLWAAVAGFVLLDLGYLALSIRRQPRWARKLVPAKSSITPAEGQARQ